MCGVGGGVQHYIGTFSLCVERCIAQSRSLEEVGPALVSQLDARPAGHQEVWGSIPAGPTTFFSED